MDSETKSALGLLIGAFVIQAIYGFTTLGFVGAYGLPIVMAISVSLQVAAGFVTCLIVAKLIGASFGLVGPAIIKLAGIFACVQCVLLIPVGGLFLALLALAILLLWLFELEGFEMAVFVITLWVVNFLFAVFVGSMIRDALVT